MNTYEAKYACVERNPQGQLDLDMLTWTARYYFKAPNDKIAKDKAREHRHDIQDAITQASLLELTLLTNPPRTVIERPK
ncbi:MAG TPA: hypothetical protein VLJ21_05030 [Candidatus Binatia bacterium]|nr:hypothetical protein [Candidatus Binatia bacterium]